MFQHLCRLSHRTQWLHHGFRMLQLQKKGVSFTWDSWNFVFKTGLFTKNTLHTRVASTQDLPCHITQVLRLMWCEYCQVCWGGISQYRKMAFWFCYKEGTSEQPDVEELPFVFVSWHDSMHKLPNPKAATFLGGHIDHEKSWRHLFTQDAPPTIHMPPANIPIFRIFFQHSPNHLSIRARSGPQWNSEMSRWDIH